VEIDLEIVKEAGEGGEGAVDGADLVELGEVELRGLGGLAVAGGGGRGLARSLSPRFWILDFGFWIRGRVRRGRVADGDFAAAGGFLFLAEPVELVEAGEPVVLAVENGMDL